MNSNKLSVIIPTYNSEKYIENTVNSLKKSQYPIHEIILIDDSSNDNTISILSDFNIKIYKQINHTNANRCRNIGARISTGDILVFLDSDVIIKPDTLLNLVNSFENSEASAVVGLYAVNHSYKSIFSKYKNLWIRYSYLKSQPSIDWIFAAISGIKKDVFLQISGFDESLKTNQIDDIELGKRISSLGLKIILNPKVEVIHQKEYSFSTFISNEYNRSQGFVKIAGNINPIIKSIFYGIANIYPSFVISTILSNLVIISLIAYFINDINIGFFILFFLTYSIINIPFLRYFYKQYFLLDSIKAFFIQFIDHFVCFWGSIKGFIKILKKL